MLSLGMDVSMCEFVPVNGRQAGGFVCWLVG